MTRNEITAHKILSLLGQFHSDWNVASLVKILEESQDNLTYIEKLYDEKGKI